MNEKILVAKHMFGFYRIYDKNNPQRTLATVNRLNLPEFLTSCVTNPPLETRWDKCEVIPYSEPAYTVEFDADFRREIAKDLITKLVAVNTGTNMWVAEDIIDETDRRIFDTPECTEEILSDYLGLTSDYLWVFKRRKTND